MDRCHFPQHHVTPSRGPAAGWLAALAAAAVILAEWHVVLVVLAVAAVLTVGGLAVLIAARSAGSEPYDAAWHDDDEPEVMQARPFLAVSDRDRLTARVGQLEQQLRAARLEARPEIHQHLHLHGLSADDADAIVARQDRDRRGITGPPG